MRQFAGFGTVEETNERFHYLLDHGQTGLSTAFDMPTLMGYDSDHARSLGEVGREGVAVDSLDDMEQLFDGIPLGGVTTSMTINAPAAILLAFYVLVGERQGVPADRLGGTIQTDILKEYIAQKEWCFPIEPAMRLVTDMIEWCSENMPRWHPVSISGYHIREAGLDRPAGARLHAQGRLHLRRAGARARPRRRRLRAAPLLLLQRPHRLLRGDRQVPGGAPDLGARAARHLRRQARGVDAAALPRPDRRRLADRPAAAQQRRPHLARGAGGGARRHPVAAHQLLRRGAGAADRGGGAGGAAHAAGDRLRIGRRQHARPARRLLVRRAADRRDGGRRLRLLRPHRRAGGDGRGDPRQLPAARDRRRLLRLPARGRRAAADRRRRQRLRRRGRGRDADPADRPGARTQAGRSPGGDAGRPRRRRGRAHARRAQAGRGRRGQPDAADPRRPPGPARPRAR